MSEPKTSGMIRRMRTFALVRADGDQKPSNRVMCVASTDENYDWGYYREQLLHGKENVDVSPASSVLMNHDRNQIIGGIVNTSLDGGQMRAELEIDPDVMMENGMKVLKAVQSGYVRGISIGYEYSRADCDVSEDANGTMNVVVKRWQLREISITPTPADVAAQITRQLPEGWLGAVAARTKGEAQMSATNTPQAPAAGDEVAKERAEKEKAQAEFAALKHATDMDDLARSHKVEWKREEAAGKTKAECLQIMLERKAKVEETRVEGSTVVIGRDASDKADEAAEDALMYLTGLDSARKATSLGMRSGSVLDIGRRWCLAQGFRDVAMMTREELADALIGDGRRVSRRNRINGKRDGANVTSAFFTSYVLANAMDKTIYGGFNGQDNVITYDRWCKPRIVADFKTFYGGALDTGNLVETAEDTPFPELLKDEGGYSDALSMWGATVSLTYQALVNDDLGQFMTKLGMAGFIARRTVDKKVYSTLAGATWTSRTSSSSDLADATVSALRASMAGITGPAGEILGMVPRFLIVPSGLRSAALGITQVSPSLVMNDAIKVNTDLHPIITPFLTTAGTPSQSTWYLACDTMLEPMVVATLAGVDAPIVEEYDAGATAARKWKIMFPFKAVVPTVASKVQGIWQGTH